MLTLIDCDQLLIDHFHLASALGRGRRFTTSFVGGHKATALGSGSAFN